MKIFKPNISKNFMSPLNIANRRGVNDESIQS